MIQCSNFSCQALNEEHRATCQNCQTPLVHRYLWAVGADLSGLPSGTQITQRYRHVAGNIVLDQTPEYLPSKSSAVVAEVLPYLNLAALLGRVPIPHTCIELDALLINLDLAGGALLLLEQAPLARRRRGATLLPTLAEKWPNETPLRQLNWLRQIAELWSPLQGEGVVTTLGTPSLLRVDESWLRLLELRLQPEGSEQPSLRLLGNYWQELMPTAHPAIQEFLATLVEDLRMGQLVVSAELTQRLELGIGSLGVAQPIQIAIATYTDKGPTRQRNEDACYPPSGTVTSNRLSGIGGFQEIQHITPWVIVCDGIGGHEGGDVASSLAIETIQSRLQNLQRPGLLATEIHHQITQAILAANDVIYSRNNQELRKDRGRMGTTLVLKFIYPPFLFIAHVGDSRAYRISASSCSQITLDDDVAARESRLGYALYRDALRQPSAGSLIQALGITESRHLYPFVQCALLDDHSVYLICSDGLSDYDRVEALWWSELRKPISEPQAVATVGQQLIDFANTYNGHDNVTLGLMALNSLPAKPFAPLPKHLTPADLSMGEAPQFSGIDLPQQPTTVIATFEKPRLRSQAGRWLLSLFGLGLAGAAGWWFWQDQAAPQPFVSVQFPRMRLLPEWQITTTAVRPGDYWQVQGPSSSIEPGYSLRLAPSPDIESATKVSSTPSNGAVVPTGSILKIIRRQDTRSDGSWAYLEVCSIPSGQSLAETPTESGPPVSESSPTAAGLGRLSEPGQQGWLPTAQLQASAVLVSELTASQRGGCQ
mgnify:CR=1 FL=1